MNNGCIKYIPHVHFEISRSNLLDCISRSEINRKIENENGKINIKMWKNKSKEKKREEKSWVASQER